MTKFNEDIQELVLELVDDLDIDISNPKHLLAIRRFQKRIIGVLGNYRVNNIYPLPVTVDCKCPRCFSNNIFYPEENSPNDDVAECECGWLFEYRKGS